MTRPIGVAVLAALFFSCPNVKQQPVHQRADNAQYPVAQISNSTADVPILESPGRQGPGPTVSWIGKDLPEQLGPGPQLPEREDLPRNVPGSRDPFASDRACPGQ